jgi:hypothetical protein
MARRELKLPPQGALESRQGLWWCGPGFPTPHSGRPSQILEVSGCPNAFASMWRDQPGETLSNRTSGKFQLHFSLVKSCFACRMADVSSAPALEGGGGPQAVVAQEGACGGDGDMRAGSPTKGSTPEGRSLASSPETLETGSVIRAPGPRWGSDGVETGVDGKPLQGAFMGTPYSPEPSRRSSQKSTPTKNHPPAKRLKEHKHFNWIIAGKRLC